MTTTTAQIDQLDAVCKRQTGRFVGHLRRTGQLTEQLERDVVRQFGFVFEDVRKVFSGTFEGNHHEHE